MKPPVEMRVKARACGGRRPSSDPAIQQFEDLVASTAAEGGEMQNVQDTLNSFRSYDADRLQIQLEWIAQGRARVLVNGEPLLSDAGLPLTLFTRRHRQETRNPRKLATGPQPSAA